MEAEPESPARRRIPAELWAGVLIVVVCFGAYLGARWYSAARAARLVRALYYTQGVDNETGLILCQMMALRQPRLDGAIAEFAAQSRNAFWIPEHRLFVRYGERHCMTAHDSGGEQRYRVAQMPEGVSLQSMTFSDGRVRITFALSAKASALAGASPAKERALRLSAKSLAVDGWSGLARSEDVGGYSGSEELRPCSQLDTLAEDLRIKAWLRLSGEDLPSSRIVDGPGPAAPARDSHER